MDPYAITADVDAADIDATVRILSGDIALDDGPIVSRNLHHPDILRAGAWLQAELGAIDRLSVRTEPFRVSGQGVVYEPVYNVIADLPGTEDLPYIVIGAHYDSIASFDEDWTDPSTQPAPGADDDGSGVAAVVAIARALAAYEPGYRHPIRFVLFSGEEEGLLGSFAHVETLADPVDAMIQLDSIGYKAGNDELLWYTYDEQSAALATTFGLFAAGTGTPLVLHDIDAGLIGGDARSDHYPFWQAGIPAVHMAAFPLSPDYHTMNDVADTIDPVYTRDVAALAGAWVANLAEPNPAVVAEEPGGCGCNGAGAKGSVGGAVVILLAARRRRPNGG
jgi:leucyl aminopeptidase